MVGLMILAGGCKKTVTPTTYLAIDLGSLHSMSIKSDGTLRGWGKNDGGALGDGSAINKTTPFLVGSSYASVSGEFGYTLAIRQDGTLWS